MWGLTGLGWSWNIRVMGWYLDSLPHLPDSSTMATGSFIADSRRKRSAWLCDTGLQSPPHCLEPLSADMALTLRTDHDSPVDHLDVDVVTE